MLDYMNGPIWCESINLITFERKTNIDVIDNGTYLKEINDTLQYLYSSYFEFDSHELPCYFNEEQEKKDKQKMLNLLGKLNKRLTELNDGTFEVADLETERVKNFNKYFFRSYISE